jgi:hypothetical protein
MKRALRARFFLRRAPYGTLIEKATALEKL